MIGTVIGNRYVIEAPLGTGGMGTVYRGLDRNNQQFVAVKTLTAIQSGRDQIEAFLQEGQMLRDLDHPNILRHLNTVQDNELHYLILEYAEGGDLGQRLESNDSLKIAEVLLIGLDVADALTRAHRLGIIHRDLKPANILLTNEGTPRLADFGIARFHNQIDLEGGELFGTIPYMSPETITGAAADELTDIWSFGVLLFECLTGQHPFIASTTVGIMHAIQNQELPDLQTIRPEVSDGLTDLVYRMLSRQREIRIPSVRLVGAELEALIKGYDLNAVDKRAHFTHSTENGQSKLFQEPTPVSTPPRHNLPAQPTPFVGRTAALQELSSRLTGADTRLVTVLGPGGMGKTRFALQIGEQLLDRYLNGVFLAELAPIERAEGILSVIAEAVGLELGPGVDPMRQLQDFFQAKNVLLLLDNFEHLLDGAALVSELLEAADGLTVLATSRERLNLAGEHVYRLRGMLHATAGEGSLEDDAVSLFTQGARRVQPGFQVQNGGLAAIQDICRQVEGMPLAIEMAAAWVKMLSPAEILTELTASSDILESERRDAPKRHRSIRAVIKHSWSMLDSDEQRIFSEVSVFRNGFTREAGQSVTGANLRQLMSLIDKSLIRREPDGRFKIHELLRQFASEQLRVSLESYENARNNHCRYYVGYLDSIKEALNFRPMQAAFLEMDNLLRAWRWAINRGLFDELLNVELPYMWLFEYQGLSHEQLPLFQWSLDTLAQQPPSRTHAVFEAMMKVRLNWVDRSAAGIQSIEEGIDTLEQLGEVRLTARAKSSFAIGLGSSEKYYERSCAYLAEIVPFYRQHGPLWQLSYCLDVWGQNAIIRGDVEDGFTYATEALEIDRAIDNPRGIAWSLATLADLHDRDGDLEQAVKYYTECLQRFREIGYQRLIRIISWRLGDAHLSERSFQEAGQHIQDSLDIATNTGSRASISVAARSMGWLFEDQGQPDQAAGYFRQALEIMQVQDPRVSQYLTNQLNLSIAVNTGRLNQVDDMLSALKFLEDEEPNYYWTGSFLLIGAQWLLGLEFFSQAVSLLCYVGSLRLSVTRYRALNKLADLEPSMTSADYQSAYGVGQELELSEALAFAIRTFEAVDLSA